jgi:hypothetical protein
VHNWREFLSEVRVVVLGTCIALADEQVVVGTREARLSGEARLGDWADLIMLLR